MLGRPGPAAGHGARCPADRLARRLLRPARRRGFYVIRFDNRDVGLSTKITDAPKADIAGAVAGDASSAGYTLDDMADDAVGLLDALGIDVGARRRGVDGRDDRPDDRRPAPRAGAQPVLDHVDDRRARGLRHLRGGPGCPPHPGGDHPRGGDREPGAGGSRDRLHGLPVRRGAEREQAGRAYDRCYYPVGIGRQLVAIPRRAIAPRRSVPVAVPTVVIHGSVDPLVPPVGGELTAEAIPGAQLVMVEGMGHDLPEGVWSMVVESIVSNTELISGG